MLTELPDGRVLYVATYRNTNTGRRVAMGADFDLANLQRNTVAAIRLHRFITATRVHWLLFIRRWPVDVGSITTRAYRLASPAGHGEGAEFDWPA